MEWGDYFGELYAGASPILLAGVARDSRLAQKGDALFAFDPRYVADGLSKGVKAVISFEKLPEEKRAPGVAYYRCDDLAGAFARSCAFFYADAIEKKVAVTGTNGKTSVTWILRELWERTGKKAVSVGTLGVINDGGEARVDVPLTTPDAASLHKAFKRAGEEGAVRAVIEASSHGLQQRRVAGCRFALGMFTNLTQDHLDYHKNFDAYFAAKCLLFDLLEPGAPMIANADSPYFSRLQRVAKEKNAPIISVGEASGADCRLISMRTEGATQEMRFAYKGKEYGARMRLRGEFQCRNALYALCAFTYVKDGSMEEAVAALASVPDVPGRMQCVAVQDGAAFYVDYAHTPDALENALAGLRRATQGSVVVVFGCGGDRDAGKRPIMGQIASRLADAIIVTDDNPRSEAPEAIRAEVLAGCDPSKTREIGDRRAAIAQAVKCAKPGDAVLIAGKGHEDYQEVMGTRSHFSDVEETLRALKNGPHA
ncbi:MAG: UDP-N-acetylmuramoyl-L-alanyl-D-glutamate--2,6-diaminopimelate ligase [Rickettsiales bacterium]